VSVNLGSRSKEGTDIERVWNWNMVPRRILVLKERRNLEGRASCLMRISIICTLNQTSWRSYQRDAAAHEPSSTTNVQHVVKFGIVYIDGSAAISNISFETPDDDHIGRNMSCTSDLKFEANFKIKLHARRRSKKRKHCINNCSLKATSDQTVGNLSVCRRILLILALNN
jgi:hypothetical protein